MRARSRTVTRSLTVPASRFHIWKDACEIVLSRVFDKAFRFIEDRSKCGRVETMAVRIWGSRQGLFCTFRKRNL